MNKLFLVVFLAFLVYASATNPDKKQFATHLAHQQINKTDDVLGKGIIKALKKYTDQFIEGQMQEMDDLIVRKNYFLFSEFEVELPLVEEEVKYIGALNTFVKLPSGK